MEKLDFIAYGLRFCQRCGPQMRSGKSPWSIKGATILPLWPQIHPILIPSSAAILPAYNSALLTAHLPALKTPQHLAQLQTVSTTVQIPSAPHTTPASTTAFRTAPTTASSTATTTALRSAQQTAPSPAARSYTAPSHSAPTRPAAHTIHHTPRWTTRWTHTSRPTRATYSRSLLTSTSRPCHRPRLTLISIWPTTRPTTCPCHRTSRRPPSRPTTRPCHRPFSSPATRPSTRSSLRPTSWPISSATSLADAQTLVRTAPAALSTPAPRTPGSTTTRPTCLTWWCPTSTGRT